MTEAGRLKFVCGLFRVPTEEYLAVARAAERAGFEALSLSDPIVHLERVAARFPDTRDGERPWSAPDDYPDVWVATAMMAAVTQRLRFLQAIYVLPVRDPFPAAGDLKTPQTLGGHGAFHRVEEWKIGIEDDEVVVIRDLDSIGVAQIPGEVVHVAEDVAARTRGFAVAPGRERVVEQGPAALTSIATGIERLFSFASGGCGTVA